LSALLLAALAPATALAGTFDVHGLGLGGAGCPSGWHEHTFTPAKLNQETDCASWRIWSNRNGTPMTKGHGAAASMFAAEGARFTGFSIQTAGTARNGMAWQMGMCQESYSGCVGYPASRGTWFGNTPALGTLASPGAPQYARQLYAGVWCDAPSCPDDDTAGRAADVAIRSSHAVVEDFTAPGAPDLSGIPTGWTGGEQTLSYTASDAGSGLSSVAFEINGKPESSSAYSCMRLPDGAFSHPLPCSLTAGGSFPVDTRRLADGRHTLTVTVRDAGGEPGSMTHELNVDNNAPESPRGLTVTGGSGWRRSNDFELSWQNPDQGDASPIAAAYHRVGSLPRGPIDGERTDAPDVSSLSGIRVPHDGEWPVYVWLRDEATNAYHVTAAGAHLRLDSTAPALEFQRQEAADNPTEVRVPVTDAHSGVAGGEIEIRRQRAAVWQSLPTRREASQLVAAIPDDRLEQGTYELRATAWDAVENVARTTTRADGRPMVVDLPLRGGTAVTAALARAARGTGATARSLRTGYAGKVWVRGVLRSESAPLPGARVVLNSRPLTGGVWSPVTEVVTDAEGRYSVELPPGGSRELLVTFPGTALLRPSQDDARLFVRGWASLVLTPRRLRRGGTIAFRGRVGRAGTELPPRGKLVQVQYLDGRRWRPAVRLGRTDGRGRFAIHYRFRRISRPTRIYFRMLVPAEGGWPYATGWSRTRVAHVRP
jgi:hypothetical protein